MTRYEIVPSTLAHVKELVNSIRREDAAEVEALGLTLSHALSAGVYRQGETFLADGKVVCMFGLEQRALLSRIAYPWLLSSVELPKHAIFFARSSRKVVKHWAEHYDVLVNYVDSRYAAAIRWLEWCGFDIIPDAYTSKTGVSFHRFEMVK